MKNKAIFIICLAAVGLSFANAEMIPPESYSMTAYAADKTVSEDLILESDMTVEGDLILKSGELNLNGHTLTVKGDFLQSGGSLRQSGVSAALKVYGNYEIKGDGSFQIYNGSILDIDGDVIVNSTSDDAYFQSAGTLRIGGNLSVYSPEGGSAFNPNNEAVVEFKGEKTHVVYFDESELNSMCLVAVTDGGKLNLTGNCTGFYAASDITLVDSKITGGRDFVLNGHTVTAEGDFVLAGSAEQRLQLGGSEFIVKGDFIQSSGYLAFSGDTGILRVSGNYELSGDGGFEIYNGSILDIDGDVIVNSTSDNSFYQSSGTLRIGGNLSVYSPEGGSAFNPNNEAVVEFKDKKTHVVYFEESELNSMCLVAVTDGGKLNLTGNCTGFYAASDITLVDSKITGGRDFVLNGHTVTAEGDFVLAGSAEQRLQLGESELIVYGDFIQSSGYLAFSGDTGILRVGGNYEVTGDGSFEIYNGSILDIDGDVIVNSTSDNSFYQSSGTLRIGGNLSVYDLNDGSAFRLNNDAIVEFKGAKAHKAHFYNEESSFVTLKLGIGDSVAITGNIYSLGSCDNIKATIDPKELASINGLTITGKEIGVGELVFVKGDETLPNRIIVDFADTGTLDKKPSESESDVAGDVNADGIFNIADLVAMKKWLLAVPDATLKNWQNGDLCKDNRIDIYDFIEMRKKFE